MNWSTLRIAIVGPLPPPAGGMAGQTQQLAELLRAEGTDVRLVQTNTPYRPAWVARYRGARAVARLIGYMVRLWWAAGEVQILHVMANSGWSWHLFAAPAIWIGRLRGVRVVVNYRGGEARPFLERSVRWVRPSLKLAAALIVPSGFLEGVFARAGFVPQVVPNVVNLARFRPSDDGRSTAHSQSKLNVLVPRNLEAIYDNATALRAFALVVREIPMARLVIAGSGPEEGRLRLLAQGLGIDSQVEFTGRLDREQIAVRFSEARVMVNPSLVDNTPNSVLEAMASGVPIVSTNVGGVPFIVRNEHSALLVPAGDPHTMAVAIIRVLSEPGLAERLRCTGIAEVQRYSWAHVRDVLGEVYEAALGASPIHMRAAGNQ